jgi:hypothetical protein
MSYEFFEKKKQILKIKNKIYHFFLRTKPRPRPIERYELPSPPLASPLAMLDTKPDEAATLSETCETADEAATLLFTPLTKLRLSSSSPRPAALLSIFPLLFSIEL